MHRVVTIDGPAGAGKSTVARKLADRLGWRFLDTGAMYRAVTLAALRANVDLTSDAALCALVEKLEVRMPPGKVMLGGEDVTESIRSSVVTESSRFIADSPSVRRRLSAWQREFAATENVVTEGRDQGTLVFPDAFRKYFLTASEAERARRRLVDHAARQEPSSFEAVLEDIRARDARDAHRTIAPMKPADDAIIVDSTGLTIDGVVDRLAADVEHGGREEERQERGDDASGAPGGPKPGVAAAVLVLEKQPLDKPAHRDRSRASLIWYRVVQCVCSSLALCVMRWRAKGQGFIPAAGGVLLVCNHVSFLDVFFVGIPLRRPLNYVARSTLFVPALGMFIRSVGGFPIQREGIGASGMKETLRRLKAGGIVTLFPEGTRSPDGELGPLKPGIAVLAARVGVPVVPAAVAGLHESWPRSRPIPVPHPVRIHYGPPIMPGEMAGLDAKVVTELIRRRMQAVHDEARQALRSDMKYC
jgi:1-acyl-sn-glycerol-3-phosphate acyltransferase